MMRWLFTLLFATLLGACASGPPADTQPTTERESLDRSARLAFSQGQYAQAATLYTAALDQALAEDRADAIVDARFNLALSYTYIGRYQDALDQLTQAEAERGRRGLGGDSELDLLRAIVLYRDGNLDMASSALDPVLDAAALSPSATGRAHFLAGLIAADRGVAADVRRHLQALEAIDPPGDAADRTELAGRFAAIDGDLTQALALLDRAVAMRGLQRDYRGMVRSLAAAGDLAERDGQTRLAADYLLRAGRSAAQREAPQARIWLQRALDLGQQSGDRALALEARSILDTLPRDH